MRGLSLLALCLVIVAASVLAHGSGATQTPSPLGTPSSSPAASPSPVFTTDSATPAATPRSEQPLGALGRTDSNEGDRAQPIRPSGRISIDGGPLRGGNVRRPTLATRSVYDPYRLLESDQRTTLRADTERLMRFGLPTLVYIRISQANDVQAAAFADRLLDEWNVESAPGANDGVVILISMGVTTRRSGEVMVRTGPNALPQGGLNATRLGDILEENIEPQVERGRIYSGVLSGLRTMSYTIIYYPEPQAPLTAWQQRVADLLAWLAPALGAVSGVVLLGWLVGRPRRLTDRRVAGRVAVGLVIASCALLSPLAVYAHSRLGIAVVVLLGSMLAAAGYLVHWRATRQGSRRAYRISVGPWLWRRHPQGSVSVPTDTVRPTPAGTMARRLGLRRRAEGHGD